MRCAAVPDLLLRALAPPPRLRLPRGVVGLRRSWFARDSLAVGPDLLNKVVVGTDGRWGRIIEVEAYRGPDDPGSHAFRGRTRRNAVMWGPAGHLYVYFIYGMHYCANVVCGPAGVAQAVLFRAVQPEGGLDVMRAARWGARVGPDRDLCRGPARFAQAFGITGTDDGSDVAAGREGPILVGDDGRSPPDRPLITTRIGLSAGAELPWRFAVPAHPGISGRRAAAPSER